MEKKILLERIKDSFFCEKKFDDFEIVNLKPSYPEYEGNEVGKFFKGKTNIEVKLSDLLDNYPCDHTACIAFMKPEPASYFIGAYMHMGVENEVLGQDIRFSLMNLFSGALFTNAEDFAWFDEVKSKYSESLKSVIRDYIQYLEKNHSDHLFIADFAKAKENFK